MIQYVLSELMWNTWIFFFSLLFDTICVIERGIESRIHVATADNENMVSALQDSHASLELLGKRCKEVCIRQKNSIVIHVAFITV